jgi:hypothetical protein
LRTRPRPLEENRWEALPSRPIELSGLFQDLWGSAKAAERWLAKNPPDATRNIIRVWGVFDYKPKRQRRWSTALVRHGADPRSALAGVLSVSAGDIRARDRAD